MAMASVQCSFFCAYCQLFGCVFVTMAALEKALLVLVLGAVVCTGAEHNCSGVICQEEPPCPPDSFRLPGVLPATGCCAVSQGCSCLPTPCPPPHCSQGSHPRVLAQGGKPGSCCALYECVPDEEMSCKAQGQRYANGATWQKDKCTQCLCRDGLTFCEGPKCHPLPPCSVIQVPEGDCCPVCVGCRSQSGAMHNNSAHWQEDPCTTCSCVDGQRQCQVSMCKSTCLNPRHVEGECCPICDQGECDLHCEYGYEEDGRDGILCKCKAPLACPPLTNCPKNCSYGYRQNKDGCEVCKCNKCKGLSGCRKTCLHGYLSNDKGCPICKCKETPEEEERSTTVAYNPSVERICLSPEGHRHEEGEMWSDGCHICYCHWGLEMCTLITCPIPKCKTPDLHPGECCPRCPTDDFQLIQPNVTVCHSVDGAYRVEGETWSLGPCTKCICHHGQVLCDTQICPPAPCPNAHVRQGECCPSCPFFRMTAKPPVAPLKPSCPDGSNEDGKYMDGDMWRAGPCKSCLCRQGNTTCYDDKCPPVSCSRPVLRKNQCCSICLDHNPSDTCQHENTTYAPGESWMIGECTHCECSQAQVTCTEKVCSVLCPNPTKIAGRCCPVCLESQTGEQVPGKRGPTKSIHVDRGNMHSEEDMTNSETDVSQVEKLPPSSPPSVALDPFCIVLIAILFLVVLLLGVAVYVISQWRKRLQKTLVISSENSNASYTAYQPTVTSYKDPKSRVNKYCYDKCNGEADCKRPINEVLIVNNLDAPEKLLAQV